MKEEEIQNCDYGLPAHPESSKDVVGFEPSGT